MHIRCAIVFCNTSIVALEERNAVDLWLRDWNNIPGLVQLQKLIYSFHRRVSPGLLWKASRSTLCSITIHGLAC